MGRELKIIYQQDGFHGFWNKEEGDLCYIVRIADAETDLGEVRIRAEEYEGDALLYMPEVHEENKEYRFLLEIVTQEEEQKAVIPVRKTRLERLQASIEGHKTEDGGYVINSLVLEDDALWQTTAHWLGEDGIEVGNPLPMVIDEEKMELVLEGDNIRICFYLDDSFALQMTVTMDEGSLFLNYFMTGALSFANEKIYFASAACDLEDGWHVECGLYYAGDFTVPEKINDPDDGTMAEMYRIEGEQTGSTDALRQAGNGLPESQGRTVRTRGSFSEPAESMVLDVESPVQQDGFTITGCNKTTHMFAQARVVMTLRGGELCACLIGHLDGEESVSRLTLPVADCRAVVVYENPAGRLPSLTQALGFIADSGSILLLPDSLLSTPDHEIRQAGYVYAAGSDRGDERFLRVGGTSEIEIIEGVLSLSDWELYLRREISAVSLNLWKEAGLKGTFLFGKKTEEEKEFSVTLLLGLEAWLLYLESGRGNWLNALASVAGFETGFLTTNLGFLGKVISNISLEKAGIAFSPSAKMVQRVFFTMETTDAWEIIPSGLTIDKIRLAADFCHGDKWTYYFGLSGEIGIGSGEKRAVLYVKAPIGENAASLSLHLGETGMAVPSFDDILRLFGLTGAGVIPSGFIEESGLRISRLDIELAVKPETEWKSFFFQIETQQKCVFSIGGMDFTADWLKVRLDARKGGDIRFEAAGQLLLFGVTAMARIVVQSESGFQITAQVSRPEMIAFDEMADAFVTDEEDKYANLPVPASMTKPSFERAAAYMDTAGQVYALSGAVRALGSAAFVTVKTGGEEPKRGYLFLAVLDSSFTFGGLSEALAVLDSVIRIDKAGFFLSTVDSEDYTVILQSLPEELRFGELDEFRKDVKRGVQIYAGVHLGERIVSVLALLGLQMGETSVAAYAYLPKEEGSTELSVSLSCFRLFDLFDFEDIQLQYKAASRERCKAFRLDGRLYVEVGSTKLGFAGSMDVTEEKAAFTVQTTEKIERPLGIPGFALENLLLSVNADFAGEESGSRTTYTVSLSGEAQITAAKLTLVGRLLFADSSFKICSIELGQAFSIDCLFAQIFDTSPWQAGSAAITVTDGRIYYAAEDVEIGNVKYAQGFHIAAGMDVFGFSFGIAGDFGEEDFQIQGYSRDAVALGAVKITGGKGLPGPGVVFAASKGSKKLGIQGGVSLFGEQIVDNFTLGYDLSNKNFYGEMEYRGSVEAFRGRISFTWNSKDGLDVKEFPMQALQEALKLEELLSKVTSADQCGKLIDLIFENTFDTEFTLHPSIGKTEGEDVAILLTPQFKVLMLKQQIYEGDMKAIKVTVHLPDEIGFEALLKLLVDTVLDNAGEIVKQIWEDKEAYAKMLTAAGTITGGKAALKTLLCHSKEWYGDVAAAEHTAMQFGSQASGASSAGAAAGAAAGAGAAGAAGESSAGAIGAGLGALFSSFIFSGSGKRLKDLDKDDPDRQPVTEYEKSVEEEAEKIKKAVQAAREAVVAKMAIRNITFIERSVSELAVSWDGVEAGEGKLVYRITVFLNGVKQDERETKEPCFTVTVPTDVQTEVKAAVYACMEYPEQDSTYTYTGNESTASYTMAPLSIMTKRLPAATAGSLYEYRLETAGGKTPFVYEAEGLPDGLTLTNGVISGTPIIGGGEVYVEITVTDALGRLAGIKCWMTIN